jgi:hypothetical protein
MLCAFSCATSIKYKNIEEQSSIGIKSTLTQRKILYFFKTNGRSQINHVGMVVEVCEGEIKFIHSSVSNGVIISSKKVRREKFLSNQ